MKRKTADLLSRLPKSSAVYECDGGAYFLGDSPHLLASEDFAALKGKVNLILTSPPYPLNSKKSYGNLTGAKYLEWFISLAPVFADLLAEDGSIVLEIGNAWESGRPVQSLLHLESLLGFARHPSAGLRLIQQFVCYNPSRLPSPAQWVTVNRIRTVDSFTHIWWLAKTDYPKADNSKVLRQYSKAMKRLLERGTYNSGKRPSEHVVGKKSFSNNRGGSIAHNMFEIDALDPEREVRLPNAFSMANSTSNDYFQRECKKLGITPHPARMPVGLASFFIEFLTDKSDLVLDPFAGSNTTGYSAATANRRWVSIDAQDTYIQQSLIRFGKQDLYEKRERPNRAPSTI